MGLLRSSVILGAVAAAGVLLAGPVAWAEPLPGATSGAPVASGSPGTGLPASSSPATTSPATTSPATTSPATSSPATSSPATSSPAPPTATSESASPTAPPSSTAPGGAVTGTAVADCSAQQVVFTVVNGTGAVVTAGIATPGAPPFRTLSVPAGDQQVVRLSPGAGPFEYVLEQLNPTRTLAAVDGFFPCPVRRDLAVSATSGQPATTPDVCVVAFFLTGSGPAHGRVTVTGDTGFSYTSTAGYVGPDQFDYTCLTSEGVFGTVFVQVHPAPATSQPTQPAQPVESTGPPPAAAGLATTGSDTAGIVLAGAALVLAGALLLGGLALTRRRS